MTNGSQRRKSDHRYNGHRYEDHRYDDHRYDDHRYDNHQYDDHRYDDHRYDDHRDGDNCRWRQTQMKTFTDGDERKQREQFDEIMLQETRSSDETNERG